MVWFYNLFSFLSLQFERTFSDKPFYPIVSPLCPHLNGSFTHVKYLSISNKLADSGWGPPKQLSLATNTHTETPY